MRLVKPIKALGQHFLKDLQIARQIAETLDAYKGMPVLEIGPGMGVLTQFLLDAGHDLSLTANPLLTSRRIFHVSKGGFLPKISCVWIYRKSSHRPSAL